MLVIFLMIIPIVVDARITINITVHSNESDIFVHTNYTGDDNKVVTDVELKLFNVTKARLNAGMKKELGEVPYDIYLTNPTPYGDLFKKFSWEEIKRRLIIKKSKIIDILNEETVLDTHEHINDTPYNITSKKRMFKVIENAISSTWSETGLPKDEIFSNFTIDFGNVKFKYVRKWRNESSQAFKMSIGVTKKGHVTIKPGQTIVTTLTATKTIVVMKFVYEARLKGSVIGNYAKRYGKHHFWVPSLKSIMEAGNMTNEITTTEILELRCFTKPRLKVFDKLTGEVLEPIRKKRPLMKIIRNGNMTQIIHVKRKIPKKQKKTKI